MEIQIGTRVLASHSGTGTPRKGVVTGVLTSSVVPNPSYAVTFDRDDGWLMPCVVLKVLDD